MVARTRPPGTIHERVTTVATQQTELARGVGRGSQALRDNQDNVLQMQPGSALPTLSSPGGDVGLQWQNGQLVVVDETQQQTRDMGVRHLTADGEVSAAGGGSFGGSGSFGGGISAAGGAYIGGTVTAGQINTGLAPIYVGDVHAQFVTAGTGMLVDGVTTLNGQINMGVFPIYMGYLDATGGTFSQYLTLDAGSGPPVSHPNVKVPSPQHATPVDLLGKSVLQAVRDAPVSVWQYDPNVPEVAHLAGVDHLSPMATDVPEVAQATTGDGLLSINVQALTFVLWGAVADLADQVDALTARVAALEHPGTTTIPPAGPPSTNQPGPSSTGH